MREKQKTILETIRKEIIDNWKIKNGFLGIKRKALEDLSSGKNWKVRKVIALMRKNKFIGLEKRNYFVNMSKLNSLLFKEP